jgi:hypothetical protein
MSTAAGPVPARAVAKIAFLGVDDASAAVLTECFRQFGIEAEAVAARDSVSVPDTYSACVIPLNADCEAVLRGIRALDHRIVVYGTCGSVREALKYSDYGINAVFHTPVTKQEALQIVRSTHLLVLKELRRYVRVPLLCSVTLETGTEGLESSSIEISAGGMSLVVKGYLGVPQAVLARFMLPGRTPAEVRSVVCWTRREEGTAAIRFDPSDPERLVVRRWIDEYLEA